MSHFVVTVAVPFDRDPDAVVASIARVLDPYDENKEVEPYVAHTPASIAADERYQGYLAKEPALTPVKWYGGTLDAEGNVLSTYNPKSKWDWWEVGGRWDGYLTLKDGQNVNVAVIRELAAEAVKAPFAYVDTEGEWHEKGQMGFFGMTRNEADDEVWVKEYLDWLLGLDKDIVLVAVDCHI